MALKADEASRTSPATPESRAQMSALVAGLFDERVSSAELRTSVDSNTLFASELAICADFAAGRRSEFAAGRACAHRALEGLGVGAQPILRSANRRPTWPPDIVGSISHTAGFTCAVAARADQIRAIGVDVENLGRITPLIEARIASRADLLCFASLAPPIRARAATITFSAKEALFKTGLCADFIDFGGIDIAIENLRDSQAIGDFLLSPNDHSSAPSIPTLRGRWCIEGDFVLTGVLIDS